MILVFKLLWIFILIKFVNGFDKCYPCRTEVCLDHFKFPICSRNCYENLQAPFNGYTSIISSKENYLLIGNEYAAIFYNTTKETWKSGGCLPKSIGHFMNMAKIYNDKFLKRTKMFKELKSKNITTFWLPYRRETIFSDFMLDPPIAGQNNSLNTQIYHPIGNFNSTASCLIYDSEQSQASVVDCNDRHHTVCFYMKDTSINLLQQFSCPAGWKTMMYMDKLGSYCYTIQVFNHSGKQLVSIDSPAKQYLITQFIAERRRKMHHQIRVLFNSELDSIFSIENWRAHSDNISFTNWDCLSSFNDRKTSNKTYLLNATSGKWFIDEFNQNTLGFYQMKLPVNIPQVEIEYNYKTHILNIRVSNREQIFYVSGITDTFPLICYRKSFGDSDIFGWTKITTKADIVVAKYELNTWTLPIDLHIPPVKIRCRGLSFPNYDAVVSNEISVPVTVESAYSKLSLVIKTNPVFRTDISFYDPTFQTSMLIMANDLYRDHQLILTTNTILTADYKTAEFAIDCSLTVAIGNNRSLHKIKEAAEEFFARDQNYFINSYEISSIDECLENGAGAVEFPKRSIGQKTVSTRLCIPELVAPPLINECIQDQFLGSRWLKYYQEIVCDNSTVSALTLPLHQYYKSIIESGAITDMVELIQHIEDVNGSTVLVTADAIYFAKIIEFISEININCGDAVPTIDEFDGVLSLINEILTFYLTAILDSNEHLYNNSSRSIMNNYQKYLNHFLKCVQLTDDLRFNRTFITVILAITKVDNNDQLREYLIENDESILPIQSSNSTDTAFQTKYIIILYNNHTLLPFLPNNDFMPNISTDKTQFIQVLTTEDAFVNFTFKTSNPWLAGCSEMTTDKKWEFTSMSKSEIENNTVFRTCPLTPGIITRPLYYKPQRPTTEIPTTPLELESTTAAAVEHQTPDRPKMNLQTDIPCFISLSGALLTILTNIYLQRSRQKPLPSFVYHISMAIIFKLFLVQILLKNSFGQYTKGITGILLHYISLVLIFLSLFVAHYQIHQYGVIHGHRSVAYHEKSVFLSGWLYPLIIVIFCITVMNREVIISHDYFIYGFYLPSAIVIVLTIYLNWTIIQKIKLLPLEKVLGIPGAQYLSRFKLFFYHFVAILLAWIFGIFVLMFPDNGELLNMFTFLSCFQGIILCASCIIYIIFLKPKVFSKGIKYID